MVLLAYLFFMGLFGVLIVKSRPIWWRLYRNHRLIYRSDPRALDWMHLLGQAGLLFFLFFSFLMSPSSSLPFFLLSSLFFSSSSYGDHVTDIFANWEHQSSSDDNFLKDPFLLFASVRSEQKKTQLDATHLNN